MTITSTRYMFRITSILLFVLMSTFSAGANGWILPNNTDTELLTVKAPTGSQKNSVSKSVSDGGADSSASTGWILNNTNIAIGASQSSGSVAGPAGAPLVRDAAGNIRIVPSTRSIGELFRAASTVVTGFSGQVSKVPKLDPNLTQEERAAVLASDNLKFIDLEGQSATLSYFDRMGYGFNGDQIKRKPYDTIIARDVGQVFGIAMDDERYPNLYLTASSAFGLQIVGDDKNSDLVPDRLTRGALDARWMPGQWGSFEGSGPGSIYKVDGFTRQISLFATIEGRDGRQNSGAGLGNIAFDRAHKQFFVSDLETGLIQRVDSEGRFVQAFDHGIDGRGVQNRSAVRFNPLNSVDITRGDFDTLNPQTWNIASPDRRVWGLAVRGSRLYYAVAGGPEVWSIGIDKQTGELFDPRWELTVAEDHAGFEISDIVFTPGGSMVLAQRPAVKPSFDYTALAEAKTAKVLRYVYESPRDNPDTPSVWYEKPEVVPVGFLDQHNNGLGGVDLGPSFDQEGRLDWRHCNGALLSTGQNLRYNFDLKDNLTNGGQLRLDGIQIIPREVRSTNNTPPWLSFHHDYDGKPHAEDVVGHIGDVEVLDCGYGSSLAGQGGRGTSYEDYAEISDQSDQGDPDETGPWCTRSMINAGLCNPKKRSCVKIEADVACNRKTGLYELIGNLTNRRNSSFDGVKVVDPSGFVAGLPTIIAYPGNISVPLSGLAPGQVGQLNLCAFDSAERADNQPYNCCNRTVNFKIPGQACVKEVN